MIDGLTLFMNSQIYELLALFYFYLKFISFKSSLVYLAYFMMVYACRDHDNSCE